MDCLLTFSQIVAAIYNYMAHLTGLTGNYACELLNQQNGTKITAKKSFL